MIVSALVNGLWQGVPIVLIAFLLARAVPPRNAATRYALWFATLLALAIVPVLATVSHAGTAMLDAFRGHATPPERSTITLIPMQTFAQNAGTWFDRAAFWALPIWIAGVTLALARLGVSFVRITAIRRSARPVDGFGSGVFRSDRVSVPIVAGIARPAVIIPDPLVVELPAADLKRIVEHERAHIARRDPLFNFLQRLIEAIFFFNPWVLLAGRYVCAEREAACDDWAIDRTGSAVAYAACLAELAATIRSLRAPLLTPSVFGSRHALVSRIARLGSGKPPQLFINSYAVGGIIMLFAITTLVLQALSPALAFSPSAAAGSAAGPAVVAAACAHPNVEATVTNPVAPVMPHGLKTSGKVEVAVTIGPSANVTGARVLRSSGDAAIDQAVLRAVRQSTYSSKLVNCSPVQGGYVFRVDYVPDTSH